MQTLSYNPCQTAKNEDITHTFSQLIQYILIKYAFAHLVLLNCKFRHTKTLFSDHYNSVKSSPKSRKWHFRDSKFKNFLGPSALAFSPPNRKELPTAVIYAPAAVWIGALCSPIHAFELCCCRAGALAFIPMQLKSFERKILHRWMST
jgi:hypothetical protein